MSAPDRLLPVTIGIPLTLDRLLLGESGHKDFDAKPRAYEFASGCLGSFPAIGNLTLSVRWSTA